MREVRRVWRKKTVLIFCLLWAVNFALFLSSCGTERRITPKGEELFEYLASYPEFLAQTAESGRILASLNLERGGYASQVLRRSTEAYAGLSGTAVTAGDNRGVVLLLQYRLTDVFLLAFLMSLAADFLAERRKGLTGMVRCTLLGRGELCGVRIVILFVSAVVGAAFLYGGNYAAMALSYGESDLSRSLQSLPEFMKCPYAVTVGEYLFVAAALKTAGCLVAALLFFLLVSLFGSASAYGILGGAAIAEFFLRRMIAPVATANVLRYCNLYTVITAEEYFADYHFVHFFGNAVPAITCAVVFLGAAALITTAACLIVHGRCYVLRARSAERVTDRIRFWLERHAPFRSLAGWECYKLFVAQGGLLIVAGIVAIQFYLTSRYEYSYPVDPFELLWYDRFEGEITREVVDRAEREFNSLEDQIARLEKKIDELSAQEPVDGDKLIACVRSLESAKMMRSGLIPVLEAIHGGWAYTERSGRAVELIRPYSYEMLLVRDEKTRERANLFILIGLVVAASGVFAYDAENHMGGSIRTAYRGRLQTVACKLCSVLAFCALACVLVHLVQIRQIGIDLGYDNIKAPVQSLAFLRDVRLSVSIRGYLALVLIGRSLVSFGVGLIPVAVSRCCKDRVSAMGISAFLFVVPVLVMMI